MGRSSVRYEIKKTEAIPVKMLEEMLGFIKENLPEEGDFASTIFKSKYILTELVTNAIKHTHCKSSTLRIEVTPNMLTFLKTDKGKPLTLPSVPGTLASDETVVTSDIMHTLYTIRREDKQYFYCKDNATPIFEVNNDFPEHFGLLIITKAADEFYYNYDTSGGLNVFRALVNF
jgi:anti-sigma regulatory factor (Ser/Thr protein kinase)